MSFIAKNPISAPKINTPPTPPLEGTRGIFPMEDGWYDINDDGAVKKIGGENPQSDWNQYDESQPDYVKNRTHYIDRRLFYTEEIAPYYFTKDTDKWDLTMEYFVIDKLKVGRTYEFKPVNLNSIICTIPDDYTTDGMWVDAYSDDGKVLLRLMGVFGDGKRRDEDGTGYEEGVYHGVECYIYYTSESLDEPLGGGFDERIEEVGGWKDDGAGNECISFNDTIEVYEYVPIPLDKKFLPGDIEYEENKSTSIDETNQGSDKNYPSVKAVVDYVKSTRDECVPFENGSINYFFIKNDDNSWDCNIDQYNISNVMIMRETYKFVTDVTTIEITLEEEDWDGCWFTAYSDDGKAELKLTGVLIQTEEDAEDFGYPIGTFLGAQAWISYNADIGEPINGIPVEDISWEYDGYIGYCYGYDGTINIEYLEVKKIDYKYIPEDIATKDDIRDVSNSIVQSDWIQNDKTAKDYIKNKTHGFSKNLILIDNDDETSAPYVFNKYDNYWDCYRDVPQCNLKEGHTYEFKTVNMGSVLCTPTIEEYQNSGSFINAYSDDGKVHLDITGWMITTEEEAQISGGEIGDFLGVIGGIRYVSESLDESFGVPEWDKQFEETGWDENGYFYAKGALEIYELSPIPLDKKFLPADVEYTSNKTTILSESSTDEQYPSAKSVVDYVKNTNDKNVVVDQTYSPTSENAQSGKAVAEAIDESVSVSMEDGVFSVGNRTANISTFRGFELIASDTLVEDVVQITPAINGQYKELYIFLKMPPQADVATNTAKARMSMWNGNTMIYDQAADRVDNYNMDWYIVCTVKMYGTRCYSQMWHAKYYAQPSGIITPYAVPSNNQNYAGAVCPHMQLNNPYLDTITVKMSAQERAFPVGTKYELWGVRK